MFRNHMLIVKRLKVGDQSKQIPLFHADFLFLGLNSQPSCWV